MTIKQQGGIFGRNPTFNDVTIDNSLLLENTSGVAEGTIRSTSGAARLNITSTGASSQLRLGDTADIDVGLISYSQVANTMSIYTNASLAATFTSSGNLAFPSGQGIDFSATSGTGTSELFDDYEEGTWTPTLNGYGGTPTVSGYYVKIGQMVYVECSIELDGTSDASNYIITGLPFTMASPQLGGGAVNTNDGGVADVLVGSDASGRLRLRDSSNSNYSYTGVGVSSTVTLNAQYRAA